MLRFFDNNAMGGADSASAFIYPGAYISFKDYKIRSHFSNFTIHVKPGDDNPILSINISRESHNFDNQVEGNFELTIINTAGKVGAGSSIHYSINFRDPYLESTALSFLVGSIMGSRISNSLNAIQAKCNEIFKHYAEPAGPCPEQVNFGKKVIENIEAHFGSIFMEFCKKKAEGQNDNADSIAKLFEAIDLSLENAMHKLKTRPTSRV